MKLLTANLAILMVWAVMTVLVALLHQQVLAAAAHQHQPVVAAAHQHQPVVAAAHQHQPAQ